MERTQSHVIAVLTRAGYPGLTERWLVFLRAKCLLPPLRRGHGQGKAAYYYWSEPDIVRRLAILYDLLPLHAHIKNAYLPLWLLGFNVPLDIIRARLLRWTEGDIFKMTKGIDDGDEIEWILGKWLDDDVAKSQRSRRASQPVSYEFVEEVMQPALNILANRRYKINKTIVKKLLKQVIEHAQKDSTAAETANVWRQPNIVGLMQNAGTFVQQYLSVHALHDAIATATEEELRRAQRDFGAIVGVLRLLPLGDLNDTEWWQTNRYHILAWLGRFVVAGSLALRHSGHGIYVDQATAWLNDTTEKVATVPELRAYFRRTGPMPPDELLNNLWPDRASLVTLATATP